MSRHRTGFVTVLGYATAAAITITIFVYLTFPWQKLSEWIRIKVEQAANLQVTVQDSRVRFPFLLVWKGVAVSRAGHPVPVLMTADQISVGWPIGAILRRHMDLDLAIQAWGGEARGRLTARRTTQGIQYHLEASGKGFELGRLAALFQLPSEDMFGTVRISRFEHDWTNQDWMQGQGIMSLEASEVGLKRWEIRFKRLNGSVTLKAGMSNLENFSAQGEALDLVGSGSLLLRSEFMESLLNFNSRVTLHKPTGPLALLATLATPDGHLDFSLRGVLKQPTPYVNGSPFSALATGSPNPSPGANRPVGSTPPAVVPQRPGLPSEANRFVDPSVRPAVTPGARDQ
ncbi:MAG TPA: type II secretion system protein GspN [Nitrospiria bacterium]|jgi:type II secretion system protein N|nr:type II secretion system protein GspN [Nitrospiria bacterium]